MFYHAINGEGTGPVPESKKIRVVLDSHHDSTSENRITTTTLIIYDENNKIILQKSGSFDRGGSYSINETVVVE